MSIGTASIAVAGAAAQPSPAIWADCRTTELLGQGLGYYVHNDFLGDTATEPGIAADADSGTTYTAAATATYGPNVEAVLVSNTDNNAVALRTAALGKIIRGSAQLFHAEIRLAVGALGDSAFAFGLTTLANATRDVVADNPSTSAQATLTSATFIGFVSVQASSALATVNIVNRKTTGTEVSIATNVTNATAIALANRSNLVANTFVKLGLRFDGNKTLHFYVNGVRVARYEVDTTVDQATDLCVVFNQKTGAATQIINYVDFIRAAYQLRA